jgi:hypothetical protein
MYYIHAYTKNNKEIIKAYHRMSNSSNAGMYTLKCQEILYQWWSLASDRREMSVDCPYIHTF